MISIEYIEINNENSKPIKSKQVKIKVENKIRLERCRRLISYFFKTNNVYLHHKYNDK
jgi:hypothetical protein